MNIKNQEIQKAKEEIAKLKDEELVMLFNIVTGKQIGRAHV